MDWERTDVWLSLTFVRAVAERLSWAEVNSLLGNSPETKNYRLLALPSVEELSAFVREKSTR